MRLSQALILLLLVGASLAVIYYRPLSIVNMPEGFDVRFYGFNPNPESCYLPQCVYALNSTVDPPYYYSSRGLYNAVFGKQNSVGVTCDGCCLGGWCSARVCLATDSYEFKVNIETPEKVGSELAVKYYIRYPNGTVVKVVAWREVYEFNVEIVSVPKKALFSNYGDLWYAGVAKDLQLWFVMGTVVWNRALTDPDNPSIHSVNAFNVPIAVYVVSSQLNGEDTEVRGENSGTVPSSIPSELYNYVLTDADAGGRRLTLYDEPSDRADPVAYFADPNDVHAINSSLAGDPDPDSRFRSVVFFPITLTHFGNYYEFNKECNPLFGGPWVKAYVWYPAKTIRLRVIYLKFGKFVYTLQKDTSAVPSWTAESPHVATTAATNAAAPKFPAWGWPDLSYFSTPQGFLILLIIAAALLIILGLVLMFAGGRVVVLRA